MCTNHQVYARHHIVGSTHPDSHPTNGSLPTPTHTHHLETIINDDLFLLGRHVKEARVGLHLGESRVSDWCRHLTLRPRPRVAFRLLLHCHVKCRSGPKISSSDQCEEGEGSWLDPWIPAKNIESSRVEEVEEKGGVEKKAGRA